MQETPTTPPIPLQDLLAYRDGEPLDEAVRQSIENDPHAQEQLARLGELKAQLNGLAPVVPEPGLWTDILQRAQPSSDVVPLKPPRRAQRAGILSMPVRLATAAGVFGMALLASLLWFNGGLGESRQGVSDQPLDVAVQPVSGLDHLLVRSRELETALMQTDSQQNLRDPSQRALLYRIADLDEELRSLQEQSMRPELKERLWRQRVGLLETLTEIQRYQMLEENNAGAL